MGICTHYCIKIDNQGGPTGNSTQYSTINRKRIGKGMDTYMGITESVCCTPVTNMLLLIKYTPI